MKQDNKKLSWLLCGSIVTTLLEIILITLTVVFFNFKASLVSSNTNDSIVIKYYSILICIVVLLILFCVKNLVISTFIWSTKWNNNFSSKHSILFGVLSSCLICVVGTLIFFYSIQIIHKKKHNSLKLCFYDFMN